MKLTDFLIIGGGIAGNTAAETFRELDPYAAISIIEAEPYHLYSRVMIPGYLTHRKKRDALFLRTISDYAAKKISLYLSKIVSGIDYQKREVYTDTGEVFPYKKLLIASGGRPKPFSMPNSNIPILRMHTLDDADDILAKMKSANGREVLVTGEGLIATEFIKVFLENGFTPHIVVKTRYFNERKFGETGGKIIEEGFLRSGVVMHRNTEIMSSNSAEIFLRNGEKLAPALIGAGVGITRNLEHFGEIKKNIGILTNEFLETLEENVYAAGDVAEFPDVYSGVARVVGNWTNSALQGRAVAFNAFASLSGEQNKQAPYQIVPTYNITNLSTKLTFLGFLDDSDEVWEKFYDTAGVTRVFLKEKKIKGAVLINRFDDKIKIAELIKAGGGIYELEKAFI